MCVLVIHHFFLGGYTASGRLLPIRPLASGLPYTLSSHRISALPPSISAATMHGLTLSPLGFHVRGRAFPFCHLQLHPIRQRK
ncbi:hypothetical protein P691DRAFT_803340 [Macrolepiota fuliginosa MF-IS2]|uniref:Uncharacterized protein n=1 Tax=Macrolepiota fuliginosa MF-IS2 TaxID=1400762 RepID=A0A9P5XBL3_9AGAR|nr:hypothetical protein P691DRAFT_803340 [Macrolepiota fuliginosa MF-IS2]